MVTVTSIIHSTEDSEFESNEMVTATSIIESIEHYVVETNQTVAV